MIKKPFASDSKKIYKYFFIIQLWMLWYHDSMIIPKYNDCWFSDSKVIVIIVNHYIFKIAFALGLKNALTQEYNNILKCFLIKLRAKLYIVPFTYSSSIQNLSQIYKHSHTQYTRTHTHIYFEISQKLHSATKGNCKTHQVICIEEKEIFTQHLRTLLFGWW